MVYHCAYGLCNSDSRYKDRPNMTNVTWHPFPKPHRDIEKCHRWVHACGRQSFTVHKVTKSTMMCSLHFVGGRGPTLDHPDPIPAHYTPSQIARFASPPRQKRKASRKVAPLTLSKQFKQNQPDGDNSSSVKHKANAEFVEVVNETPVQKKSGDSNTAFQMPGLSSISTQTEQEVDARSFQDKSLQTNSGDLRPISISSATQTDN